LTGALDVNLLLYASDHSSPFHEGSSAFLSQVVTSREVFCLTWPTVMAYLRIATHPSVFRSPLVPAEAMRNVSVLLASPYCRVLSEEEGFWQVYQRVAAALPVRGNLVGDAHLVALMLQHDVRTLFTNDADFRKFSGIRVRNPLGEG
jgi:toxin-antitoxin system PIN domain toxin